MTSTTRAQHRERLFAQTHREHHDRVYLYLRRRTESHETAEDLCAETFRIVWQKLAAGSELSAGMLFGVARNVLRNHQRSQRRFARLVDRIREGFDRTENQPDHVHAALARLKPADREILILTYWDGFPISEAADLLGCTPGAARVRLHRARKAFASYLSRTGETP
ncbi:RNA polymerase sigma-70 factor (ECF subfamily) [Arthrobacter pigmenti]|uniref:RNA polymerase sigma-70 factor (ECF subfamily) n=1 Tax=Arthrobacter pigmenti TaxID=271432 RepID=A0A846RSB1_9MICC|nr:sigma-70 family RNA polymerase sigma factor [Arthrobacter pigmenti]NJC21201.1 RNA polymerase sigma-70 factor (ECF subfamily) [Arthrobacter pigmenti]